jgi:DNA-binding SARP family transcriptional activator
MLLLRPNHVVSTDELIEGLWGEHRPETAAKALQGHVSALRELLEPERASGGSDRLVVTRPPGYEIQLDPERLDVTLFERLRWEASAALAAGDADAARVTLGKALPLWRGPPLADFTYEPFAQPRSRGSRSCVSRRSKSGSTPSSHSAVTRTSSVSSRR